MKQLVWGITGEQPPDTTEDQPESQKSHQTGTNAIGKSLKLIEPDTFMMGVGEDQHQVTLTDAFYLGVYPVTQKEYEEVIGDNPSAFKGEERRPVENVTWFEAIEFCNRLSEQEGLSPYYEVEGEKVAILGGDGYRLPTEAEWEYACRAGSQKAYCFGDDEDQLKEYAWYGGRPGGQTHPVGHKKANDWGLYDMHGNVYEWCWDGLGKYPTSPQENATGSPDGSDRVIRGGCWFGRPESLRSADRRWLLPDDRYYDIGFRVARSSG